MSLKLHTALVILLLALPYAAVWADDAQAVESLRRAAEGYVQAQAPAGAQISADAIDARMRLPACGSPLTAASGAGGGGQRWTVAVNCAGPQAWTVYVPVKVASVADVVVAARNLPAGSQIAPGDVRVEKRDTSVLAQGYLADAALAVGQMLSRPLAAGAVLTPPGLARPSVVRRGDLVTLVSRSGGFEVRTQGKALANGALGERLAVENSSSRRVVQGQVAADGTVEIAL
ncbi:MAG: flgA [Hydrocarboniphaga sp.]|uniref:flagellar basal body P-ring formation chaperone FlgA n=1 Tax=Hydrocarboniphaga sp. TaxID=2033016 RepID=UPI00260FB643|nr:flagellar basal body P-ring formation chaperone FlgA [Hydrocarboniphaga sp.]MDB5967599.1 flgA [Hydrocarboniphaga sp.]